MDSTKLKKSSTSTSDSPGEGIRGDMILGNLLPFAGDRLLNCESCVFALNNKQC